MQNRENKYYQMGGLVVSVTAPPFPDRKELIPFRCDEQDSDLEYVVELVSQMHPLTDQWRCIHKDRYIHTYEKDGRRARLFLDEQTGGPMLLDVSINDRLHQVELLEKSLPLWGSNLAMKVLDLPIQMIQKGGIFLHASFIKVEGYAILFAAQKQVGKSTQAELWRRHRGAEVINGDRAILRKIDGRWCACGSPYCGTSDIYKDAILPIRAIVLLSQAPQSQARQATARERLAGLLDCCSFNTWDRNQVEQVINLAGSIMEEVHFVKLSCTPDVSAVKSLEDILW